MNSAYCSTVANSWQASDGGNWWLRDTPNSPQPSGDYEANCLIGMSVESVVGPDLNVNDNFCYYPTGPYYVCSTNDNSCLPGSYSATGHEPCTLCSVGRYSSSLGATNCFSCGRGLTTNLPGAVSLESCVTPSSGTITTFAGTGNEGHTGDGGQATSATIASVFSFLTFDPSGTTLYFAETSNQDVRAVDLSTGIISTFVDSSDGMVGPAALAFDPSLNAYIADFSGHRVWRVDAVTHEVTSFAGTGTSGYSGDGGDAASAQLSSVHFVVYHVGSIYIVDHGNHCVRKVDMSTNIISTVAGTCTTYGSSDDGNGSGPATSALLHYPTCVIFDSSGNMFIADNNNNR